MQLKKHEDLWDEEAAKSSDTPGRGMFAPEVLGPAVERLKGLAGEGSALEFAIDTGRVAIPLLERGVKVSGIEIARPMVAQLRTKVDERALPVAIGDMTTTLRPGDDSMVYLVFNGISCLMTQALQEFLDSMLHSSTGKPRQSTKPPTQVRLRLLNELIQGPEGGGMPRRSLNRVLLSRH